MSEVPSRLALFDDYMNSYTQPIRFDPQRTILVVVDMQYASGCRIEGLVGDSSSRIAKVMERSASIESSKPSDQISSACSTSVRIEDLQPRLRYYTTLP